MHSMESVDLFCLRLLQLGIARALEVPYFTRGNIDYAD
jgi:hypothetical protein